VKRAQRDDATDKEVGHGRSTYSLQIMDSRLEQRDLLVPPGMVGTGEWGGVWGLGCRSWAHVVIDTFRWRTQVIYSCGSSRTRSAAVLCLVLVNFHICHDLVHYPSSVELEESARKALACFTVISICIPLESRGFWRSNVMGGIREKGTWFAKAWI